MKGLFALFILLGTPYVFPILAPDQMKVFSRYYAVFPFLLLVIFALVKDFGRIESTAEKQFWKYVTAAFVSFFLYCLLYAAFFRVDPQWDAMNLAMDSLTLISYIALLGAIEQRPHVAGEWNPVRAPMRLSILGVLVFCFGLLTYFILLPINLNPGVYYTWLPSVYVYLVLEIIISIRFLSLARSQPGPRWSAIYGLMGLAYGLWSISDLLSALNHLKLATIADGSLWDLIFFVPFGLVVLAARVRHFYFAAPSTATEGVTRDPDWVSDRPVSALVYAFLLLAIHLTMNSLGLLDQATRSARDRLVLLCSMLLIGLAWRQHTLLTERGKVEALKQSEEKYRLLFERDLAGVYRATLDGRILDCNQAVARIFGYDSREEVLARSTEDFCPLRAERKKFMDLLEREGKLSGLEMQLRSKDGSPVWTLENATLVTPRAGEPPTIEGTIIDITDRKRAEEALRLSEDKFEKAFQAGPDVVVLTSVADHRLLEVNDAFVRLTGYEREEAVGHSTLELGLWSNLAQRESVLKALLEGRRIENEEASYRTKSGEQRVALISADVIRIRDQDCVIAICADITERKRAEEALLQSERRYRSLVQGAAYGIYRSSLEDRFFDVNPALVTMLGYSSAEEVLALKLSRDLYADPELRPRLIQQYHRTKRVIDVEVPWKRKDGKVIIVRLSGRAVFNQGETEGFEMIAEDVTERQQLEEELRQAQKMEAVGQLAGGMAHDFSNILTGITLFAGLIGQSLPRTGSQRRHVQEVLKAAKRGSSLIAQLLAFSRKQTIALQALDVNAVLREEVSMLKQIIPENIELVMSPGKRLEPVRMDRGQVAGVLMNLVLNAKDAMPKGGKLVIETANVVLDEHYARQRPGVVPGPYVLLSVSDTGEGMSAEVRARVFEPFFTTKPQGEGTGLGLATVYGTVKQNWGHISVYSEQRLGSAFKVYLPRIPKAGQESIAEHRSEGWKRPVDASETILLVEDERSIREPARKYLTTLGYKVLSARDGQAALDLAREYKLQIDLVVTDVVMPRIGGPELAKRMKMIHPTTKVLYMSGYGRHVLVNHLPQRKGTPFLQKPFTLDMFARQIRKVLDTNGGARRSRHT